MICVKNTLGFLPWTAIYSSKLLLKIFVTEAVCQNQVYRASGFITRSFVKATVSAKLLR